MSDQTGNHCQSGNESNEQPIPGRCGAWSRQAKRPCRRWPRKGCKRCDSHGGKSEITNRGNRHAAKSNPPLFTRFIVGDHREAFNSFYEQDTEQQLKERLAYASANLALWAKSHDEAMLTDDERRYRDAALALNASIAERLEKVRELKRNAEQPPQVAPVFEVNLGSSTIVRGANGEPVQAMRAPDGAVLLQAADGSWRPALRREVEGTECYALPIESTIK